MQLKMQSFINQDSSHGPWKMEASRDKLLLKAEKLTETAKSLGKA